MTKQFAVLKSDNGFGGLFSQVPFEGDRGEVYAWLMTHGGLDTTSYYVLDRQTGVKQEEGVFLREYQGETEEHKCLSEARFRAIVREELSKVIDAARKKAGVPEYLDAEKMEDAIIAIVETVSEHEAIELVNKHEDQHHDGGYS